MMNRKIHKAILPVLFAALFSSVAEAGGGPTVEIYKTPKAGFIAAELGQVARDSVLYHHRIKT